MEAEVREALRHLITAFENHLEAVASRRSPNDAAVDDAYEALAAAFERYEEKLDLEFAEGLPVVLDDAEDDADFEYDEADDADDDDDEDESGAAGGAGVLVDDVLADDDDDSDDEADDIEEFNLRD